MSDCTEQIILENCWWGKRKRGVSTYPAILVLYQVHEVLNSELGEQAQAKREVETPRRVCPEGRHFR